MLRVRDKKNKGQALIMITFSLVAMCGIMGLAVDLGWGYFVKKTAQRAADAAALAGVEEALDNVGQGGQFKCNGLSLVCVSTQTCAASPNATPPLTEYDTACLYAKQNGFFVDSAGKMTKQNVIIDSNTTTPPPTAPGIAVDYWMTVRATQQIPQLFSSIFGFYTGQSSARATAAVLENNVNGSLYLLARENDANSAPPPKVPKGTSLFMQGSPGITASGAVYLASAGSCVGGSACAGHMGGAASITAGFVGVRGTGTFDNTSGVNPTPVNGMRDPNGGPFRDPMAGKYQPPPPVAADVPATPVPGGSIIGGAAPGGCTTVNPGSYYATDAKGKATGGTITFQGCVNFAAPTGFGNYVFFGGVSMGNGATVTVAPGRYIFAGVNGSQGSVFSQRNGSTIQDQTPLDANGNMVPNTDPGEIFVFTDANYTVGIPDGSGGYTTRSLYVPPALSSVAKSLVYGDVAIQTGNSVVATLHGLNPDNSSTPAEVKTFAPTIFWTDQGNSPILYDISGNIMDSVSCGGGGTLATPCPNPNSEVTMSGKDPSTLFDFQASPNAHLYGAFYQPRGDTLDFQGHGTMSTPFMIITGTLVMHGSPQILQPLPVHQLVRRMVALVE